MLLLCYSFVLQMLAAGDGNGGGGGSETGLLLQQALKSLDELRLDDAEKQFLRTFRHVQEKSPDASCLVHIYTGLAEVCTRRSRSYRQNPLEWLWLCVHAGALLGEAAKLCQGAMDTELDNQTRDWLSAQQEFAAGRAQNLTDVVARTLLNWLKEDWRAINPFHSFNVVHSRTPMTPSHYPLTAIQGSGLMKPYHAGYLSHGFSLESLHEPPVQVMRSHFGSASWFHRIQLYCHRRMHSSDVKDILKEVLAFDENASSSSVKSTSKQNLDMDTASGDSESISTEAVDYSDVVELSKTDTPVKEYSFSFELASSNVDQAGWDFFLEKRKDYVVEGIIQLVIEEDEETDGLQPVAEDEGVVNDIEEEQEKEIFSPLQENLIRFMLAKIYHRLVDHLLKAEAYTQAEILCENILEIIDDIQDSSSEMMRFSAQVMQNTGLL